VYLSFVFDHRILDGASADAFLTQVKQSLESWS
jgi:pyruvate/2-oxoglutarate dehydrogenase complex dihydrolipoamide acyltransferase (E2) component